MSDSRREDTSRRNDIDRCRRPHNEETHGIRDRYASDYRDYKRDDMARREPKRPRIDSPQQGDGGRDRCYYQERPRQKVRAFHRESEMKGNLSGDNLRTTSESLIDKEELRSCSDDLRTNPSYSVSNDDAKSQTRSRQMDGGKAALMKHKSTSSVTSIIKPTENNGNRITPQGIVFLSKKQRELFKEKEQHEKLLQEKEKEKEILRKRRELEAYKPSEAPRRPPPSQRYDNRRVVVGGRLDSNRTTELKRSDTSSTSAVTKSEDATADPLDIPNVELQRAWDTSTDSHLANLNLIKLSELEMSQNRKDLNRIREHYLGLKKEKRRIQKPSEKFRNIFNFEWNLTEDTAKEDYDVLYQSRVEPQLLYGRGFRAGIDVREQRRHNNFYDELIKRRFEETGEVSKVSDATKEALTRSRDIEARDPSRRHWTNKSRDEMTDRDWRIFREDFEIYIKGGRVPPPARKWEETGLPSELLQAVKASGYEKPTPIQMQAIPIALEQRDLIGIAETGSGKTAAFVLPMLSYVKSLPPLTDETSQDGPYALVLAPSRELALQIDDETKKFASYCNCRTVAVVGGRSAEVQAFELRRGAEMVIGTPGRIKDCLERSYTVLSQCNYVVLDEADRMIDLGFEEIVNWILDEIPSTNLKSENEDHAYQQELHSKTGYRRYRLTHMFSATMPPEVERLTKKYLKAPAFISIGDPGAGKRDIEQRLEFIPEGKKRQRLEQILTSAEPPVMIFVNQKKVADVISKTLQKMGFNACSLHGGKAQDTREQSLADFKSGDVDILVATDVAGRGIDVEGVQLVINFDMPKDIGSYTHRIGRTGRAGKKGRAISFCTEDDSNIFYDLKQLLISTNNVVPLELANHSATKIKPGSQPQQK